VILVRAFRDSILPVLVYLNVAFFALAVTHRSTNIDLWLLLVPRLVLELRAIVILKNQNTIGIYKYLKFIFLICALNAPSALQQLLYRGQDNSGLDASNNWKLRLST